MMVAAWWPLVFSRLEKREADRREEKREEEKKRRGKR